MREFYAKKFLSSHTGTRIRILAAFSCVGVALKLLADCEYILSI